LLPLEPLAEGEQNDDAERPPGKAEEGQRGAQLLRLQIPPELHEDDA
jgi:hypothetical protein